ncbi:MAG TPA: hypothetical protein VGI05_26440, partial [Streptosporangiaceae bacterium]
KAVVFAGDGQLISQWGGVLEAADVPPTMIVGTHRPDDEMLRLHEYSPALWTLSIWMLSIATRSRACTARRYRTVEIQADPVSSPPPTYCPPVLGPADITGGAGTRTHP